MTARIITAFENMRPPDFNGDFDTALQNYFILARRSGVRDGRLPRQIHGTGIVDATGTPNRPVLPTILGEGDAIWTSDAGVWVGVLTADCLPVLFDAKDRVMAVHAGWRGLARGILKQAVDFLGGASAIAAAWLGPAACGCCYTVGREVPAGLAAAGIEPVLRGNRCDLPESAARHLSAMGIAAARTDPFGCTVCDRRFHSHRRDGERSGRNLAAIARIIEA